MLLKLMISKARLQVKKQNTVNGSLQSEKYNTVQLRSSLQFGFRNRLDGDDLILSWSPSSEIKYRGS